MERELKDSFILKNMEIPIDWEVVRLKNLGYLYGGLTGKSGDDFNVDEECNSPYILYIPFTNIFNNSVINTKQLFKVKIKEGENQNLVNKNDLLFLMSSEDNDGVGKPAIIEEQIENLSLNSFCRGFRISRSDVNAKYLYYHISSHLIRELIRQEAKGFIRINLRQDKLACIPIFLPPLSTQQRIANFLDRKCAEIDELTVLQETIIAELKQYKQSVITEAVTKGLNKNVPMKDSGVEWIGEIPERWEVKYLSLLFSELKNKNSNLVEMNLLSLSYGKIIRKDITSKEGLLPQSFESYNIIDKNDIVFRLTDLQNDKKSLRTGLCPERGIITSAYITLRKRKELKSSFFYYLFHSYDICKVFYGLGDGVRQGMNYMDLKKLQILFPPLSTQQVIADYLDDKCAEIDELIAIKQQKLEALKEFKKSIIFEYVTGKKNID